MRYTFFLAALLVAATPALAETCDSKPFTLGGKPAAKPVTATKPAEPPKVTQAKPPKPPKKPITVGVAPCKAGKATKAG